MFVLRSHAKISLFTKVLGRGEDGSYAMLSLFAPLDLHDTVTITDNRSSMPSLVIEGKYGYKLDSFRMSSLQDNVIAKVLSFMHEKYFIPVNLDISLKKEIPIGACFGGSDSNVALMLDFCNQYFGLGLQYSELVDIGSSIDKDVSFFLQSNLAVVVSGQNNLDFLPNSVNTLTSTVRNDLLDSVKLDTAKDGFAKNKPVPVVLIVPRVNFTEEDVQQRYSSLDTDKELFKPLHDDPEVARISADLKGFKNLEALINSACSIGNSFLPVIKSLKHSSEELLGALNNFAGVTFAGINGFGLSYFAICKTDDVANDLAVELNALKCGDIIKSYILPCVQLEKVHRRAKPSLEGVFFSSLEEESDDWIKIF